MADDIGLSDEEDALLDAVSDRVGALHATAMKATPRGKKPAHYGKDDWKQKTGVHGGQLWTNVHTGKEVYSAENPGGSGGAAQPAPPGTPQAALAHGKAVLEGKAAPSVAGLQAVAAALDKETATIPSTEKGSSAALGEEADFAKAKTRRRVESENKPNPSLPEQTRPQLSEHELLAVQMYTAGAYEKLNAALRQTDAPPEKHQQKHRRLQEAFARAKTLDKPVSVQRGLALKGDQLTQFVAAAKAAQGAGKTLRLPGYTSTTTEGSVGVNFQGSVEMHIDAVHGLDTKPYSYEPEEKELLLNHGSQFTVTAVKQNDKGVWQIHLRQQPPKK